MKEFMQEFIKRTSIIVMVIGLLIFLIGVAGQFSIKDFNYAISSEFGRIATIILGIVICGIGVFLIFVEAPKKQTQKGKDSEEEIVQIKNKDIALQTENQILANSETFIAQLLNAQEIWIEGYSLLRLLMSLREPLSDAVSRGGNLQIILVDPKSNGGKLIQEHERSDLAGHYNEAIHYAKLIAEKSQNGGYERVKVKLINWIPSCCMIILNPHAKDESGYIRVAIYPPSYHTSTIKRPNFTLTKKDNEHWYSVFVEQFTQLWNEGKDYSLRRKNPSQ